jgi:hypothetical protein
MRGDVQGFVPGATPASTAPTVVKGWWRVLLHKDAGRMPFKSLPDPQDKPGYRARKWSVSGVEIRT